MSDLVNLFLLIFLITGILLLACIRLMTTKRMLSRAVRAPWSLSEFIKNRKGPWNINQWYYFSEENVRSLGHRFTGRLDGAILHWEDAPILDIVIDYKFPVKHIPEKSRPEDVFQLGLYALAILESGVSCSSTKLATIYCLQDRARRCLERQKARECWRCSEGRIYVSRFKPKNVLNELKRLNEVWYEGRHPRPAQDVASCRVCPYSKGKCNYSLVWL